MKKINQKPPIHSGLIETSLFSSDKDHQHTLDIKLSRYLREKLKYSAVEENEIVLLPKNIPKHVQILMNDVIVDKIEEETKGIIKFTRLDEDGNIYLKGFGNREILNDFLQDLLFIAPTNPSLEIPIKEYETNKYYNISCYEYSWS